LASNKRHALVFNQLVSLLRQEHSGSAGAFFMARGVQKIVEEYENAFEDYPSRSTL
jgi:hypothetical protein